MMTPSFIVPNLELNVQILRTLTVLKFLSLNRNETPILSVDKIAVFSFLIQHPFILHGCLKDAGKKVNIELSEEEVFSIDREYPNTNDIYDLNNLREILQILFVYGFATALVHENEAKYLITQSGNDFLDNVQTNYSFRIGQLAKALTPFQGETTRNIIAYIKTYTYGR